MVRIGRVGPHFTLGLTYDETDALLVFLDFARAWMNTRGRVNTRLLTEDTVRALAEMDTELARTLDAIEVPLYYAFTSPDSMTGKL